VDDRALGEAAPLRGGVGVQDHRHRGGEVETRDAGPHRDADAGVGAREQCGREAAALGAEREQRAGREPGLRRLRAGDDGDERAIARQRADAADRQREVQACGAAQRRRVPWVARPSGEHRGGARRGGHPDDGAHVARVARVLQHRHEPRRQRNRIEGRTAGDRQHARVMRPRPQGTGRQGLDDAVEREVGCQRGRHPRETHRVVGDRRLHVGPEAQRVLERVEAFEHGAPRIVPGGVQRLEVGHRVRVGRVARHGALVRRTLTAWPSSPTTCSAKRPSRLPSPR